MASMDLVKEMPGMTNQGHLPDMEGPALNVCLAAGVTTDHECLNGEEAMARLRSGCHVMMREGSAARNMEACLEVLLKEKVDFSTPYYLATQVMIVKEDSAIAKATDMADKKIAVIQGYTGEICVQDMGYNYTSFKKGTDAVMELVNGKADVVVIDSATASKYVSDNEGLKIVEDSEAFASEEYAIAVKKGNTELLDKINASIQKLLDEGTVAELADKYSVAE